MHTCIGRFRIHRARQVGEALGASIAVQISLFVSGVVLARSLGPGGRGDLAVLLALPGVAVQLACVGVPSAATYYVAQNKSAVRVIARRLLPLAVLQATLAAGVLFVLIQIFLGGKLNDTHTATLVTVASVPSLVAQYYGIHVLQGLGDLRWFNFFRLANPAAFSLGLGLSLFFGLTVTGAAVTWLVAGLVVAVALGIALWLKLRRVDHRLNTERPIPDRRQMVRFATTGFLAQVSPLETFRADTLMVASLFPSQIVGYYAVALSISNAPRFVADAIVAVAYPQISAQSAKDGRASARRYMIASFVACGGTALALALLSPLIVPLLFGHVFQPAVVIGVILVIGVGMVSVRRVGTDCLRALGRPAATTRIEVVTLGVLAVGFAGIGPLGDGKGVAAAVVVSGATGLFLTLRLLTRLAGDRLGAEDSVSPDA